MTGESADVLLAAAYLSRVAEPGSVPLWLLTQQLGYVGAARAIRQRSADDDVLACTEARHACADPAADLAAADRNDIRLITPGSPQWPHFALAPLYAAARLRGAEWAAGRRQRPDRGELIPPLALWVRGAADLSTLGPRSLAVVGSRASTPYGDHVASDWCYQLAAEQVVVVSGGAYGIDAAAHRGALAADGVCVLVSAGGLDRPYPAGNRALFDRVAERGLLVSERPPGSAPHRLRFLSRNRLIAAFGAATLIVEAANRSGALNSAGYARDLGRPVLAVPGPVTSAMSQGCHRLLRRDDDPARLVGRFADVLEYCSPSAHAGLLAAEPRSAGRPPSASVEQSAPGSRGAPDDRGARHGRDAQGQLFAGVDTLSHAERSVLDGFPASGFVTEAELSRLSAQPVQVVIAALPALQALGLIAAARQGYRLVRAPRSPP